MRVHGYTTTIIQFWGPHRDIIRYVSNGCRVQNLWLCSGGRQLSKDVVLDAAPPGTNPPGQTVNRTPPGQTPLEKGASSPGRRTVRLDMEGREVGRRRRGRGGGGEEEGRRTKGGGGEMDEVEGRRTMEERRWGYSKGGGREEIQT